MQATETELAIRISKKGDFKQAIWYKTFKISQITDVYQ